MCCDGVGKIRFCECVVMETLYNMYAFERVKDF
jgi:hypothetical protein